MARLVDSRTIALAVAAALAGLPVGCAGSDAPDGAFRAFAAAVKRGNRDAAWQLLSGATRRELALRASGVEKAVGGGLKLDGRTLLFERGGIHIIDLPASVVVVEEDAGSAKLRVVGAKGGAADIAMVRENRRWRVDLVASLKASDVAGARTATVAR